MSNLHDVSDLSALLEEAPRYHICFQGKELTDKQPLQKPRMDTRLEESLQKLTSDKHNRWENIGSDTRSFFNKLAYLVSDDSVKRCRAKVI